MLFVEKQNGGEEKGLETVLKSEIIHNNPEASLKVFFFNFFVFFCSEFKDFYHDFTFKKQ